MTNEKKTMTCLQVALLWLALSPLLTPASHAVDVYAGADIAYLRIPVASRDFTGFGAKLRLGATIWNGWGAEVQTLAGFDSDSVSDLELTLDSATGVFVRYETPQEAEFRFFVLAGFATTSFSFEGTGTDALEDTYDGFAWGFGAQEKLKWLPNSTAVVEFNSFYSDSDTDVWSISAGVRYDF